MRARAAIRLRLKWLARGSSRVDQEPSLANRVGQDRERPRDSGGRDDGRSTDEDCGDPRNTEVLAESNLRGANGRQRVEQRRKRSGYVFHPPFFAPARCAPAERLEGVLTSGRMHFCDESGSAA